MCFFRAVRGVLRRVCDCLHIVDNLRAARRGMIHIPHHIIRCCRLVLDGVGNHVRDVVDLGDDPGNLGDRFRRRFRFTLDRLDLSADFFGGSLCAAPHAVKDAIPTAAICKIILKRRDIPKSSC